MTQTNPEDIHRIRYQLTSLHLDINHVRLRYERYLVENPISLVIQEALIIGCCVHTRGCRLLPAW